MNKLNLKHLNVLELPKVLGMLSSFCSCADSKEKALALLPDAGLYEAQNLLSETNCAYTLIARFSAPSFGGIKSVDSSLARASSGGTLSAGELLSVGEVLRVIRSLEEWHRNNSSGEDISLDKYFDGLNPNKFLEEKISGAIISEDEISDHASPKLADIRRGIRRASDKVREQLDKIIHSQSFKSYLQEPIVTMRSGRYVVPVKAECRSQVSGLVHDTSSTGSTVFIEPTAVVEANNEIRVLQSQEKNEIERILSELSSLCGDFASSIKTGYACLVELDVIFAKAKLAYDMDASKPILCDDGITELKRARHPLLDRKKVVPTDIYIGQDFDTLVITGPNTGGKTVSLKTLGLLTLMSMCGMFIPANEGSRVSVFENVLCDIGDEQSIEQSLSTFSAHMTNIIEILKTAGKGSLVLIDELGAGTDPAEGAALAVAVLEKLRNMGCKTAATTHYAELKMYALQTDRVQNGCCEFDVATLKPTYRLLIGMPGRSNAFAILARLGMDEDIIKRSRELVSDDNARFEEVVERLQESHISLEKEKQDVIDIKMRARTAEEKASQRVKKLEDEREKILSSAREQAERIITSARSESNRMLAELEDIKKSMSSENAADMVRRAKAAAKSGMKKLEDGADPVGRKISTGYVLPRPLKVGDNVEIIDIDKKGTVLESPEGADYVMVQAGIIKTKVKTDNIRLLENIPKTTVKSAPRNTVRTMESRATRSASTEIDLRGKRADEALMELDSFIDSAVLSGIGTVTVIHGKGTGALRDAVRQMLKTHRSVKTFRRGVFGEGEDGVTVAELK